jgi:hypothetical protein
MRPQSTSVKSGMHQLKLLYHYANEQMNAAWLTTMHHWSTTARTQCHSTLTQNLHSTKVLGGKTWTNTRLSLPSMSALVSASKNSGWQTTNRDRRLLVNKQIQAQQCCLLELLKGCYEVMIRCTALIMPCMYTVDLLYSLQN